MLVLIKKPKRTAQSSGRNKDYDATVGMIGEVVDSYKGPRGYNNTPLRYTVKFKGVTNSKSKDGYFYFSPNEVVELENGVKFPSPDNIVVPRTIVKFVEVEKPITVVYICLCTNTSYSYPDEEYLWFYSNKPVQVDDTVTYDNNFKNMIVKCCFPYHFEDLETFAKSQNITPLLRLKCTYKSVTNKIEVPLF